MPKNTRIERVYENIIGMIDQADELMAQASNMADAELEDKMLISQLEEAREVLDRAHKRAHRMYVKAAIEAEFKEG